MIKIRLFISSDDDLIWDEDVWLDSSIQVIPPIGSYLSIPYEFLELLEGKAKASFETANPYFGTYLYGPYSDWKEGSHPQQELIDNIDFSDVGKVKDICYSLGEDPVWIQIGV